VNTFNSVFIDEQASEYSSIYGYNEVVWKRTTHAALFSSIRLKDLKETASVGARTCSRNDAFYVLDYLFNAK
jgi:hypothetical protein